MSDRTSVTRLRVSLGLGRRVSIPAWTVDSGEPGPILLLTAAQHGNEVQGSEAIHQFVDYAAKHLAKGIVHAVPMANLPAVRGRRAHLRMKPGQAYEDDGGLNMNRSWPGRADGNVPERLAHAIVTRFGTDATHVLDLHCWEKNAAPAVLLHEFPGLRELASQLGCRFVQMRPVSGNTLAGSFCLAGRVGITYECAGQYAIDTEQVRLALRTITNMARAIGMIESAIEPGDGPVLFTDRARQVVVRADRAGLFRAVDEPKPGDEVRKGETLGHLLGEKDLERVPVVFPVDGYLEKRGPGRPDCDVSMTGHHPYVSKGDRLASIIVPGDRGR